MAQTLKNLSGLFSDMKTRTIILVTAGILLLAVGVGIIGFTKNAPQTEGASSVIGPGNITSIPGTAEVSPQVAQVQTSLNQQRYQQALQQGTSSVPSVIGVGVNGEPTNKTDIFNKPTPKDNQGAEANDQRSQTAKTSPAVNPATSGEALLTPEQIAALQRQNQAEANPQPTNYSAAATSNNESTRQQAQQHIQDVMANQAKAALAQWGVTTPQVYITTSEEERNKAAVTAAASASASAAAVAAEEKAKAEIPVIKAGTIMFGILNTAISSDEPGPVLATIVGGEYRGARLVGSLQKSPQITGTNGPFGVSLTFNTMNIKAESNSVSIEAVAIDPDTARTALADDVDHHYVYRYGSLFASSFLNGFGNAISDSGSVTINNTDGSQTQFKQQLDTKQELLAALGTVGQQWGNQLGDSFNRPNTITVNSGISVGILFLADVTLTAIAPPAAPVNRTQGSAFASITQGSPKPNVPPSTIPGTTSTSTTTNTGTGTSIFTGALPFAGTNPSTVTINR